MICYIKWKILDLENNKIELLTDSWIGYEIGISEMNYAEIYDRKLEKIELFVYHNITDNSQYLYGFLTRDEKNIFKQLIKISWVWWKVALLILSLWKNTLFEAILNEDKKTIESVKWIWKKMAEKIILELKDKDLFKIWYNEILSNSKIKENNNKFDKNLIENIRYTLVNMWYNPKEIDKKLSEIPNNMDNINKILPWIIWELS